MWLVTLVHIIFCQNIQTFLLMFYCVFGCTDQPQKNSEWYLNSFMVKILDWIYNGDYNGKVPQKQNILKKALSYCLPLEHWTVGFKWVTLVKWETLSGWFYLVDNSWMTQIREPLLGHLYKDCAGWPLSANSWWVTLEGCISDHG